MNGTPAPARPFGSPAAPWWGVVAITVLFAAVALGLWRMSETRIDAALEAEADKVRDGFALTVEGVYNQMQALATMVAGDRTVQALFDLGAARVREEGGGAGGPMAAEARRLLLESVKPQWTDMQQRLGARQLHFHMVDDNGAVTSFLRVHTPSRFGDRLEAVRRIIADAAADGHPRAGFEIGRIYSGLRGVVPVTLEEGGPGLAIGVLEAGTSFDAQLATLDRQFGGGVAVLLDHAVVDEVVWADFVDLNGPRILSGCDCYVEATSRPEILDWMRDGLIPPLAVEAAAFAHGDRLETHRVHRDGRLYNLIRFPLRDYAGSVDATLPAVGSVAVWIDRTALAEGEHAALLAYGGVVLGTYALTLGLYLWGTAYARRRVELEQRLTKIAANLPGTIYQFHLDAAGRGRVPYSSAGIIDVYGAEPAVVRDDAAPLFAAIHPEDRPAVEAAIAESRATMRPWINEHRVLHPVRGEIWVSGHAMPERLPDGGTLWHGFITDVTARKQAEAALQASEERYRSVVAAMAEGILIRDSTGHFIDCNPAAERILGQPRERLMTMTSVADAYPVIHPDGSPYGGEDHPSIRCQRDGVSVRDDIMGLRKPDGTITWLSVNAEPLGTAGQRAVVASFSDITARQTAEEDLKRSNAELEQFAYVASHDLRQPLRMISSYLTLIRRGLGEKVEGDIADFMGFALDGARRMDRLIVDLLEYSRIGRIDHPRETLDLGAVVGEAVANLTVPVAEAEATVEVAPDLPAVVGDHGEMVRLFQNLIGNAIKYAAPDRPPHVSVTWREDGHGHGWVIAVTDNGTGIDPRHFDRIFGVFQRLVSRGEVEGTGIGLAVCRKIAEHHGGRIWVESTPGQGSTFNIALPRAGEGLAGGRAGGEGTAGKGQAGAAA